MIPFFMKVGVAAGCWRGRLLTCVAVAGRWYSRSSAWQVVGHGGAKHDGSRVYLYGSPKTVLLQNCIAPQLHSVLTS